MDHNLKQLENEFKDINLTREERGALKTRLVAFMHDRPIAPKGFFAYFQFSHSPVFRLAPVMLIMVIFLSGGISQVAENALPGDILYPIKTDINEEIKWFLATSPEAIAELEVDLASRRLDELEKITAEPVAQTSKAQSSKVQEGQVVDLDSVIQAHVDRAEEGIRRVEQSTGVTAKLSKVKEKLRSVAERRKNIRSAKPYQGEVMMAAPAADSSGEKSLRREFKSNDASETRSESEDAGNDEAPATPSLMMMQAVDATASATTSPKRSGPGCFEEEHKTGVEYLKERIDDIREYLAKNESRFEVSYQSGVEQRLVKIENIMADMVFQLKFESTLDPLKDELESVELELFGFGCPRN